MKRSYQIKHDFLFISDVQPIDIPILSATITDFQTIKLSKILNAKNESYFQKMIITSKSNIVINDDLGECMNPFAEKYKSFIIKCLAQKLLDIEKIVYLK